MGRPERPIDIQLVRGLASIGCTDDEICILVGCCRQTLHTRKQADPELLDALEIGRAEMKISLRRKQLTVALAGNVGMLIWLGKQLLGQSDRFEDVTPPKPPGQEVLLPSSLSVEQHAQVVGMMREQGTLPGSAEVN